MRIFSLCAIIWLGSFLSLLSITRTSDPTLRPTATQRIRIKNSSHVPIYVQGHLLQPKESHTLFTQQPCQAQLTTKNNCYQVYYYNESESTSNAYTLPVIHLDSQQLIDWAEQKERPYMLLPVMLSGYKINVCHIVNDTPYPLSVGQQEHMYTIQPGETYTKTIPPVQQNAAKNLHTLTIRDYRKAAVTLKIMPAYQNPESKEWYEHAIPASSILACCNQIKIEKWTP